VTSGTSVIVRWELQVDFVAQVIPKDGFTMPHSNLHSCVSTVPFCTPSATGSLVTTTPAIKTQLDPSGLMVFTANLTLSALNNTNTVYTTIAHTYLLTEELVDGVPVQFRKDIAIGLLTTVEPNSMCSCVLCCCCFLYVCMYVCVCVCVCVYASCLPLDFFFSVTPSLITEKEKTLEDWALILFYVLAGIALGVTVIFLILVIVLHKNKVIRYSSPLFLVLMAVGAITALISIFFLGEVTEATCVLREWFFGLGYVMLFG
jgi:7 transmembrane sweet-taste receptor of 3 GCPR